MCKDCMQMLDIITTFAIWLNADKSLVEVLSWLSLHNKNLL